MLNPKCRFSQFVKQGRYFVLTMLLHSQTIRIQRAVHMERVLAFKNTRYVDICACAIDLST